MTVFETIGAMLGIITGLGVLIAGSGYAYGQFKKGTTDSEMTTLNLLGKKVTELEKLCEKQDKDIKELNIKLDNLTVQNTELKSILQNRDPGFMDFVKLLTDVATESRIYMTESRTYMANDERKTDAIKSGIDKLVGAMQHTPAQS